MIAWTTQLIGLLTIVGATLFLGYAVGFYAGEKEAKRNAYLSKHALGSNATKRN